MRHCINECKNRSDIIVIIVYSIVSFIISAVVIAVLSLSFFSCDILRNGVFEVSGWNPGNGYHDPSSVEVCLAFSLDPDRNSVERSFSLSENGKNLSGHFSWRGNRMVFLPASPLMANKDYLITLKTDAQDTKGLNLEREFEAAFTTRNGGIRPMLLGAVPCDGGVIAEDRGRVELLFSSPMNRSSLQYLSFSPSVSGVWALEQDNCLAVFTPSENWITGRSYRLNIGNAIADEKEMETGFEQLLHFSAGIDLAAPELISACALNNSGTAVMILTANNGSVMENTGWEKDYRLGLRFSKPVDSMSAASVLTCDPSLGIIPETPPGYHDFLVFRFSDVPVFGSSYTITLGKTVRDRAGNTMENKILWRIKADGEYSKPPLLKGLRFPKDPASLSELLVYKTGDLFADFPIEGENYSFDRGINTWMELYFETAPSAAIDTLSLMEKLRFSATNGALSFSPRSVAVSGFTVTAPAALWENCFRVEIRGVITNRPYTGMVTIEIGSGLKDSLGNKSAEAQRFLLLK
ncbi:MAG: Ig-like domain-containing protein [Treponema sp.]|nr:Ig-like domain-containing protein [Treponema sp.]